MHQPLYKDRLTGKYLMPWVRLHAIKDYLDMVLVLKNFPKIRQTFNLVPSLIEQLDDYASHGAVDEQLLLTCKDDATYTAEDKLYLLAESFHCNLERQIKPHHHYFELYSRRQKHLRLGQNYMEMLDFWTSQDYADMAAWMNLSWFDPLHYERLPELRKLIDQERNYSLEQRESIIEMQRHLIRETLPAYKGMQEAGHIEVTTSPYYHPILPLLIDTNVARLANPFTKLPEQLFFHRDDAQHQLDTGIALYEEKLGCKPHGMWPSELSVSPAAIELMAKCGIKWIVLDEALLAKTLDKAVSRDEHGNLNGAEMICQPYQLTVGNEQISIFFREVVLSNEISFSYGGRDSAEAASSLYMRLKHIQQRLFNWKREGVVVIALDGENCWETYEADGNPFLRELYRRLSEDNTLNVCTVNDYLQRNPPSAQLSNLHCGSWINADYHIWIGEPLKNKAWDLLGTTRNFLVAQLEQKQYPKDVKAKAWEEIYAAEGSDWFWWFGEPNNSEHDAMFDQQFRLRLQNVYKLLGVSHPAELDKPVHDLVYPPGQLEPPEPVPTASHH
jgi:alpha-amylase/alpha-mannosidase (GH57 family)